VRLHGFLNRIHLVRPQKYPYFSSKIRSLFHPSFKKPLLPCNAAFFYVLPKPHYVNGILLLFALFVQFRVKRKIPNRKCTALIQIRARGALPCINSAVHARELPVPAPISCARL